MYIFYTVYSVYTIKNYLFLIRQNFYFLYFWENQRLDVSVGIYVILSSSGNGTKFVA
jgi:hypothetical protein